MPLCRPHLFGISCGRSFSLLHLESSLYLDVLSATEFRNPHSSTTIGMLRAAKPKLSLTVPGTASTHGAPKSPFPLPISPSPISSPTARNTALNQRGFSTLQPPTFNYPQSGDTKSILKKDQSNNNNSAGDKHIQFKESPIVTCVSPMPPGYHGEYKQIGRDERRWGHARSPVMMRK